MQRQACGSACTCGGSMTSSITCRSAGQRGSLLHLRRDGSFEDDRSASSSSAEEAGAFPGSSAPSESNSSSCAASSFSLLAPKIRLISKSILPQQGVLLHQPSILLLTLLQFLK